jgi:tRNA pseudouridine55 synthase
MNSCKWYRFRVRWGVARATDDREGAIICESASRPSGDQTESILPRFTGIILQSPPAYSAIKVGGRRAYALARAASPPALPPRPVEISELRLIAVPDRDHSDFEALVGKGTYIRALVRDLAISLGTVGHVAELRRLSVGPFGESHAISLDSIAECRHSLIDSGCLLPIETALGDIPALALTAAEAARLRSGQRVTLEDVDERAQLERLGEGTIVVAQNAHAVVALARIESGGIRPVRVINR